MKAFVPFSYTTRQLTAVALQGQLLLYYGDRVGASLAVCDSSTDLQPNTSQQFCRRCFTI